jgi:hypothetical protein
MKLLLLLLVHKVFKVQVVRQDHLALQVQVPQALQVPQVPQVLQDLQVLQVLEQQAQLAQQEIQAQQGLLVLLEM